MSHEIETYGDQAAAIFAREDAWHRLGTTKKDQQFLSAEEIMVDGHLGGWNVRKVPLTANEITPDGVTSIPVPNQWATVRDNPFTGATEALGGVVGRIWTPVQNEEHADVLNALADDTGAIFDTAGSLLGGQQIFITMRMPETMVVGGVDALEMNIVALNDHVGKGAFTLLLSPVRVVCKNTQEAAIRGAKSRFSIRHTGNAKANIEAARKALGLSFKFVDEFEKEAERMIQATMSEIEFFDALERAWAVDDDASDRVKQGVAEKIDIVGRLFTEAETNANIRGTRWAAYQSVTEYVDHFYPSKGDDPATVRAERLVTGTQLARIKREAFDLFRVG